MSKQSGLERNKMRTRDEIQTASQPRNIKSVCLIACKQGSRQRDRAKWRGWEEKKKCLKEMHLDPFVSANYRILCHVSVCVCVSLFSFPAFLSLLFLSLSYSGSCLLPLLLCVWGISQAWSRVGSNIHYKSSRLTKYCDKKWMHNSSSWPPLSPPCDP